MTSYVSLNVWWQRNDNDVVAVSDSKQITLDILRQRVAAWVSVLSEQKGDRWAVYHTNAFEFLAILLALWQLSRTACVVGDNLAGTQNALENMVDGFLGEFTNAALAPPDENQHYPEPNWRCIPETLTAVEVFTSGSGGEPKKVDKRLAELMAEIESLAVLQTEAVDTVLATVTHQHMYGLIFRLLRPFCYRQAFGIFLLEYPEDIINAARQLKHFALISSPVHLSRMHAYQDWFLVAESCQEVISSAAPLSRTDSMKVARCLNTPVKEIYGSTETGAIAWRCQQNNARDALWQPLPHVSINGTADGTLSVQISSSGEKVILPDNVLINEDRQFSLQGRIDQIVKIEGKRLSLTQLEKMVASHDWIDTARALKLTRKRSEVGVVAVLTAAANQQLIRLGRKAFIMALKKYLSSDFEAVLLPKRWRFVEQLPANTQGKVTQKALLALFDPTEPQWPVIVSSQTQNNSVNLTCELPEDLYYFDGHFPGQPILAGVVQVHWAAKFGQEWLPVKGAFTRLEAIKFQQVLLPGQMFSLLLEYHPQTGKLSFFIHSASGLHASGRLCYGG